VLRAGFRWVVNRVRAASFQTNTRVADEITGVRAGGGKGESSWSLRDACALVLAWSSILALVQALGETQTVRMIRGEMEIGQVVLEGAHVRLEPLSPAHHAGLCEVGIVEQLWRWIPTPVRTPDEMAAYIETALKEQGSGASLPFVQIEKTSGRVVGSTRYMNIEKVHHRVEIGSTWIAPNWQRTALNTESKYLLLRHAFETLGCMRVELKTDSLNEKSRAAILRIGATEEGIFRNHMITSSGRIRHTVYFSVIESEWPDVKKRLENRLKL
jgi:RimJ/RimL family protein N-acetyltransferase